MSDRLLSFETIENFRDLGGYAGAAGVMRRGVLFRSAQLSRASDKDLAQLASLDLSHVVDLRRASERVKQPDRMPQDWQGRHITSDLGGDGEAPHIQFLKTRVLTHDSGRQYMTAAYENMPFEASHIALFKGYFAALLEGRGASLIHCAAGKDRTGLLASLLHTALGVSQDDMMSDYLATNEAVNLEGRAEEMAEKLARFTGQSVSRDAVIAFMGVRPEFLRTAYSAIENQSGSTARYMDEVLGVDAAAVARLKELLSA